jgi:peptide/nickel transport system permease protein
MSVKASGRDPLRGDALTLVAPTARTMVRLRLPRVTERGVGLAIIVIMAASSVLVPLVDSVSPDAIGSPMLPPSAAHLFGTDSLGRDIFVRVFVAIRLDLAVTLISIALAMALGIAIGLVVGTLPKPLRELAQRMIEAAIAIPYLVLAIGIWTAFGSRQVISGAPPGAAGVVIALVIVGWMPFANFTIAQVLSLRGRESIVATRVLGYSYPRILLRHIAPFVLSANISYAATLAVLNITALAGLAILGVGIQQPTPELGLMVQEGIGLLSTAPWISLLPGAAILLLGIGFGLIADSYNHGANTR